MAAPATIVHVITQLELGGAQEITLLFCRAFAARGYEVHLVTGRGGLLDEDAQRLPGVILHYEDSLVRALRPLADVAAWRSLARRLRALRSSRPMIVHTHSSKAGIVGRWAAYSAGADVLVHSIHGFAFHDFQPPWQRALYRAAERTTADITHAFCADSAANLSMAESVGLLRKGQPTMVHPVVLDPADYEPRPEDRARIRREIGVSDETPLVGMLACLKPQKAPLDFVRAARRVHDWLPQAHFFVAGDGELRGAMESEIRDQGLEGRFHLLGWRRDVAALLGALDVLALTSLWEGLPRAVPQAMVAARPVVATRVDGTPEAVAHGETGLLVEPHDVAGVATALTRLLRDPALARRMGEEGKRRVAPFTAPAIVDRLDRLYGELLGRTARR